MVEITVVGWGGCLALGIEDRSSLSLCAVSASSTNSSIPTPSTRTRLLAKCRTTSTPMTTNRSQVRATLATTTPRQTAQTLVAVARRGRSAVSALVQIILLFHAEQTLLFLDPLAVDAAAAYSAIDTEAAAGAADAGCGGDAVDAGVDGVAGDAAFVPG